MPVDERSTSGTCPVCGEYTKQTGRVYRCGSFSCGFTDIHRDVQGASGILDKCVTGGFTSGRKLPAVVDYMWPMVLMPKKPLKRIYVSFWRSSRRPWTGPLG
ncbi:transposase [Thermincola ferriacetica]|uniref:transposase n=1 Tax=Thermincola ferriacetica TaxID=281456 RepID=UPI001FA71186|nr:transposase [Thermincola ferriacetica]